MPLMTEIVKGNFHRRKMGWSWADRMILTGFVAADGGTDTLNRTGSWTFTQEFGYTQVDTRDTIVVKPGWAYREWRSW